MSFFFFKHTVNNVNCLNVEILQYQTARTGKVNNWVWVDVFCVFFKNKYLLVCAVYLHCNAVWKKGLRFLMEWKLAISVSLKCFYFWHYFKYSFIPTSKKQISCACSVRTCCLIMSFSYYRHLSLSPSPPSDVAVAKVVLLTWILPAACLLTEEKRFWKWLMCNLIWHN